MVETAKPPINAYQRQPRPDVAADSDKERVLGREETIEHKLERNLKHEGRPLDYLKEEFRLDHSAQIKGVILNEKGAWERARVFTADKRIIDALNDIRKKPRLRHLQAATMYHLGFLDATRLNRVNTEVLPASEFGYKKGLSSGVVLVANVESLN